MLGSPGPHLELVDDGDERPTRTRGRLVVGCFAVAAGFVSCKGKDAPPAARVTVAPPSAAPTTTLPPTTTDHAATARLALGGGA